MSFLGIGLGNLNSLWGTKNNSKSQTIKRRKSGSDSSVSDYEAEEIVNNYNVEVLTIKDYKKAAKTLQISFKDDMYVNYLTSGITDETLKNQMDLALFEATAYTCILSGLLVGVRDIQGELTDPDAPFLAVAAFHKPEKGSKKSSGSSTAANNRSLFSYLWSMYQGGYLKFVWLANKETRQRVFEEQWSLLDKFREEVLGDEFETSWYLSDIGAIPKGRGKGLARKLIDFVCQKYIDVYKYDVDEDEIDTDKNKSSSNVGSDEESKLDSEIQSFNFAFNLDSDNLTDYSGYSSMSDAESTHSSWYYNEDDDILTQYDRKNKKNGDGAPLYLESSHPRNRKIYQKLGFTYIKTVQVADVQDSKTGKMKTLTMDLMVRGKKGAKWRSTLPI